MFVYCFCVERDVLSRDPWKIHELEGVASLLSSQVKGSLGMVSWCRLDWLQVKGMRVDV